MKLFNYWRSSASWRVRIALTHKGIDYEYIPVHLVNNGGEQNKDDYRTLNPMQQVPFLLLDDGRGIGQSVAIIEYLEECFPNPALLPKDSFLRAKARQLVECINAGIQPLQNLSVTQKLKAEFQANDIAWIQHFNVKGLSALEAIAAETAGDFLVGNDVTIADVFLAPQLYSSRRFQVDLSPYPTLLRAEKNAMQLPAFQKAHADQQPDAVK
jgi:maleylpyruvate isomerase